MSSAPNLSVVCDGIFTIDNLFSPSECLALIERAEAMGFIPASVKTRGGRQMMTDVRNNDRLGFHDDELAQLMWDRVKTLLPVIDGATACGVDSDLRYYRYLPGQQFKRHKDGSVVNADGQRSKLSYLIYLNDCDGGTTRFYEQHDRDGRIEESTIDVRPSTGSALLFRHQIWHEGTPVLSGRKYILRTDVFYS